VDNSPEKVETFITDFDYSAFHSDNKLVDIDLHHKYFVQVKNLARNCFSPINVFL